jgi:hypothetical protein
MRLWSLNPEYLDVKGLLAVWREGLLSHAVLHGQTRGYTHHPQLDRFKSHPDPLAAIDYFLEIIADEASNRGYHFNTQKLILGLDPLKIPVTEGQVKFELDHLKKKLAGRNPARYLQIENLTLPELHPLFILTPGPIEVWEKSSSS